MLSAPPSVAEIVAAAVAAGRTSGGPLVVGLCGPQGAGKSTIAAELAARGRRVAVLSLDDLYLGPAARRQLAHDVHPLLVTRGVPGTHDVALGIEVLAKLAAGAPVALPRFDKATDAPRPRAEWPVVAAVDVVVFEGWCVGAVPEAAAALAVPVNDLEARADASGTWRRFVNGQLAGPYHPLFAALDRLILLRAPDFPTVVTWRQAAERAGPAAMTALEVTRFCAHFERLTRHVAVEMPARADLVIDLDRDRRPTTITAR